MVWYVVSRLLCSCCVATMAKSRSLWRCDVVLATLAMDGHGSCGFAMFCILMYQTLTVTIQPINKGCCFMDMCLTRHWKLHKQKDNLTAKSCSAWRYFVVSNKISTGSDLVAIASQTTKHFSQNNVWPLCVVNEGSGSILFCLHKHSQQFETCEFRLKKNRLKLLWWLHFASRAPLILNTFWVLVAWDVRPMHKNRHAQIWKLHTRIH